MTDERMALAELLEKGSDSDLLREMIGYVAQRLMELDVEGLVGAVPGATTCSSSACGAA
jgi:putative transposase